MLIPDRQLWLPERLRQRRDDERLLRGRGGISRRWMPGHPFCCAADAWCGYTANYATCWWPNQPLTEEWPYSPGYHVPAAYEYAVDFKTLSFAPYDAANYTWITLCACDELPAGVVILAEQYAGTLCGKQVEDFDWCTSIIRHNPSETNIEQSWWLLIFAAQGFRPEIEKWYWYVSYNLIPVSDILFDVNNGLWLEWESEDFDLIPVEDNVPPRSGPNCPASMPVDLHLIIDVDGVPCAPVDVPETITLDAFIPEV